MKKINEILLFDNEKISYIFSCIKFKSVESCLNIKFKRQMNNKHQFLSYL